MLTIKSEPAVTDIYRQPIDLNGCFGWLHVPAGSLGDTAVALCPGLRSDALTGYRAFRLLADAMAEAGFPTLRLQYPGTGNSADIGPAEHWSAWQASIHTACDWLRHHSGARQVVLCGLRLGALLAATVAADRADVAGLILLAPVLRGRTYIRQLIIEASLPSAASAAGQGLVIGELALSPDTVRLIDQADLRRIALPARCRVAVYAHLPLPVLSECVDQWVRQGLAVTCNHFTGLEPMLRPVFMNHESPAEVDRIVAWLRTTMPEKAAPPWSTPLWSTSPWPDGLPPPPDIRTSTWIEAPLRFGPQDTLFGIHCRPRGPAADTAVVIGNASGDPHCTPCAVDLARQLAEAGIASLRFDFAGLGDSTAPGDAATHIFETHRMADFSAAIDALAALGYRRFATQGLCSGAYHALHGALGDPRVSAALLINLPMFKWRPGDSVELVGLETRDSRRLLQLLGSKAMWTQMLRGELNFRRLLAWPRVWISLKLQTLGRTVGRALGLGQFLNFAEVSMNRLSGRARTLLLYAQDDAGTIALRQAFGPDRIPPGATLAIIPGLDHSLTGIGMRRTAAEHMIAFLRQDAEPATCVETKSSRRMAEPAVGNGGRMVGATGIEPVTPAV